MDYSLLLAVHNITEEMKCTQKLPNLSSSPSINKHKPSSDINLPTSTTLSIHEDIRTTVSTDSGIAMTNVSNLPTYIQYLRVIEFIRAQQVPSIRTSSISNVENHLSDNTSQQQQTQQQQAQDNVEITSMKTFRVDLSPNLNRNESLINDNQSIIYRNSKSSINQSELPSPTFQPTQGLIGGDVWYNRQNLSRLAM